MTGDTRLAKYKTFTRLESDGHMSSTFTFPRMSHQVEDDENQIYLKRKCIEIL